MMVRDFQSVIGNENARSDSGKEGRLPDHLVACVGGGFKQHGVVCAFLRRYLRSVPRGGSRRGGSRNRTARRFDLDGDNRCVSRQPRVSIAKCRRTGSGGPLDLGGSRLSGTGPEHCFFSASGRGHYFPITDQEALDATRLLCRTEGIIPALESAHAIAALHRVVEAAQPGALVVVCLSGRGDKDVYTLRARLG